MTDRKKPRAEDRLVANEDMQKIAAWLRRCGYRAQTRIVLANESIFGHTPPAPVVVFWREGAETTKALARAGDTLRWDGSRITFRRLPKK